MYLIPSVFRGLYLCSDEKSQGVLQLIQWVVLMPLIPVLRLRQALLGTLTDTEINNIFMSSRGLRCRAGVKE